MYNKKANEDSLLIELAKLRSENEILNERLRQVEKSIRNREKHLGAFSKEIESDARTKAWEKIIEEMAHSIFTDVYVAVDFLEHESYRDDVRIQQALHHTRQIRDITRLFMWYLQRDRKKLSGKTEILELSLIIKQQIDLIKAGISTLRISVDEHEEALKLINIPINTSGNVSIIVPIEIKEAIPLILKDLIRNAMKHSDENDPKIDVRIEEENLIVIVTITNNTIISEEYANWINNITQREPLQISKSMKVGLRVIKMWTSLLNMPIKVNRIKENNTTSTSLIIPKEIAYAQRI